MSPIDFSNVTAQGSPELFITQCNLTGRLYYWRHNLFESLNIKNDFICKATAYINRVMRGLSICITCLLSVFQAVTISPNTSLLAKFKHKLKKYMISSFFYFWSFNLSFSSNRIFYVGAYTNMSETNQLKVTKYCSLFPMNYIIRGLILTMTTLRDVFLVGVMLTTSTYMVIILFRHQRQCKHLHSISHFRASPEKRATQTNLAAGGFLCGHVLGGLHHLIHLSPVMDVWPSHPDCSEVCDECLSHNYSFGTNQFW